MQDFVDTKVVLDVLGVLVTEGNDVNTVFWKGDVVLAILYEKAWDLALP